MTPRPSGIERGMEMPPYARAYLDDVEREALYLGGYGGSSGLGTHPALLVVDVTYGFCGPPDRSLLEAVETHPLASGDTAWEAVPVIADLVGAARRARLPVVFTRPAAPRRGSVRTSRWDDKNRRQQTAPADAFDLVPSTGFTPDDLVLEKEAPSAFFGTPLSRWLSGWGCDSVIVCGGTTSGCVRATVVDAFSSNLRVTVGADACFDRVRASHEIGLFDMGLKYADVRPAADIAEALRDHETSGRELQAAGPGPAIEAGRSAQHTDTGT